MSALVRHSTSAPRRLDPGVYRPNARVLHCSNDALGRCELDLAGMLLAGTVGVSPRANADEVWACVLEDPRTEHALRRAA